MKYKDEDFGVKIIETITAGLMEKRIGTRK